MKKIFSIKKKSVTQDVLSFVASLNQTKQKVEPLISRRLCTELSQRVDVRQRGKVQQGVGDGRFKKEGSSDMCR